MKVAKQFENLKDEIIKRIISRDYEVVKVWDKSIDIQIEDISLLFYMDGSNQFKTFDDSDINIDLEQSDFRRPQ